jgi:hypothetical protein
MIYRFSLKHFPKWLICNEMQRELSPDSVERAVCTMISLVATAFCLQQINTKVKLVKNAFLKLCALHWGTPVQSCYKPECLLV